MNLPLALFGIFGEVIDALNALVCLLQNLAWVVAWCLCFVLNFVIKCIGLVIAGLLAVLPSMPELPDEPPGTVANMLCWVVPVASVIASAFLWLTIYAIFLAYRILAKWVKAL